VPTDVAAPTPRELAQWRLDAARHEYLSFPAWQAPEPPQIEPDEHGGEADGPLLELATHTVSAYPGCAEAVSQIRPPTREKERRLRELDAVRISEVAAARAARGNGIGRERSRCESRRRARTAIRRFCVANRCDHMWTFTLAPEFSTHSADELWRMVEAFRRAITAAGFPVWAIVPEAHPGGHGWHIHAGTPGFVPIETVRAAWPYGFVLVSYKAPKHQHRRTLSGAARARILANYLSCYIGKEVGQTEAGEGEACGAADPPRPVIAENRKTYSTTRSHRPECVRASFSNPADALVWIAAVLDGPVLDVWRSSDVDDWEGPPTTMWVRQE